MFALNAMDRIIVNNETLMMLLKLYEYKGKTFYYDNLFKKDEQSFIKHALEEDIFSFVRLFHFEITDARLKLLIKKDLAAKNFEEQLVINIKQGFYSIKEKPWDFEAHENEVINLIRLLRKNSFSINFKEVMVQQNSLFLSSKQKETEIQLENLMKLFDKKYREKKYELTQLFVNFYIDYFLMDFTDKYQDLISLLLFYAVVIKDFPVLRYVSFFKYFKPSFEMWNNAVVQATYHWQSGYPQTDMLSRLVIETLLKAFEEVNDISYEYDFERTTNKSNNIQNTIMKFDKVFSKDDIRKAHPTVSDATIDRTLKRLKEEDIIRPIGKGRSSKWQLIVPSRNKSYIQPTLFD